MDRDAFGKVVRRSTSSPSRHRFSLMPIALTMLLLVTTSGRGPLYAQESKVETKASGASNSASSVPKRDDKPAVGDGDRLSFEQSKVAAEMTELEERMFRLSEALKTVEPENSSRLKLALKNAREELILHQMNETQQLLQKLELGEALTEEKLLLAKLQRLHDLLLSMDLDFQMRLERLRMIREILRQLDKAIQEEDRQHKTSQDTAATEQAIAQLTKLQQTLDDLIKQQSGHIEKGAEFARAATLDEATKTAVGKLGEAQDSTRQSTSALAERVAKAGSESKNLNDAGSQMGQAGESLKQSRPAEALPAQKEALAALNREKGRTLEELRRLQQKLAAERFAAMRKDQETNRQATDNISQSTQKLGESAASAVAELTRASGNMASAEEALGNREPKPASTQQDRALQSLRYARNELARVEQEVLAGLQGEVKRRVLEALTIMLERQVAVRGSTESLQPRVQAGSREALTSVIGLAKSEGRIIELASEAITMVEEMEFGIALPAALRVVRRSMTGVQTALAKGDASPAVVTAEKEIESDLKALLDAMKQLPASGNPSQPRDPNNPSDRERELNRLIAELKMIRLLQVRVNSETIDVDGKRPIDDAELAASIRKAIAGVEQHQDEVREATQRLAERVGGDQ